MCTDWETNWMGCREREFDRRECTDDRHSSECKNGPCSKRRRIKESVPGICPEHIKKLSEKKRKKHEEFEAKHKERWEKGEVRVWNVSGDKPSKWHKEPSCSMM